MKKVLIIMALLSLFGGILFSQQKQKLAMVSFSGTSLNEDERGALMDLFTGELTKSEYRNDFTLLARNDRALTTAFGELNFQRNSSLNESQIGQLGKQLGAGWVFYGTVSSFGGSSITINILDVETSQIVATVSRRFSSVYDVANGNAASEMTKELIAKARGVSAITSKSSNTSSMSTAQKQDLLAEYHKLKWVGRWLWIGGLALTTVGIICIANSYTETYYDDDNGGYYEYRYDEVAGTIGWIAVVAGPAAVVSGVPVDIIYSIRHKNLSNELKYGFVPYILPETDMNGQFNGNFNAGAQFTFSYKF